MKNPMMTGVNSMHINGATMKSIVQHWLDSQFLEKNHISPKVRSVDVETQSNGMTMFRVLLHSPDPEGDQ